jgi:hypothetical protein
VRNDDYVVSVEIQRTKRKIGKIISLHQRGMFKKISGLGTFCIQSVNEGLKKISVLTDSINSGPRPRELNKTLL